MDIIPGHYYRRVASGKDEDGDDIEAGTMMIVLKVTSDRVDTQSGNKSWYILPYIFKRDYEYVPDGIAIRQREIAQVMQEIQNATVETENLEAGMRTFNPAALPAGDPEAQAPQQDPGTKIVVATGGGVPETAKRQLVSFRTQTKKQLLLYTEKANKLKALLDEQQAALAAKMKGMQELMAVAEEAIFTIGLYLGQNEEVMQLAQGKPAPAGELIVIRQLVLYMDEECAIDAEDGGIEAYRSMTKFDEWLVAKPEHLRQVLPESKGVVAVKTRRTDFNYSENPIVNYEMNKANFSTYWLVRNGENLYRIATTMEVGDHIVPFEDEFMQYFKKDRFNPKTRDYEESWLRPGDHEYAETLKKADARKRHFMRILLMLQGFLDRTSLFRPLPAPRINILDERFHEHYVRYILDAEPGKMLPSGRMSFDDWLESINKRLQTGHRIMGKFSYDDRKHDYIQIAPRGARMPDSETLYTIDRIEDRNYVFLYDREEQVWKRDNWYSNMQLKDAERRATCRLRINEATYLNFDLATVEDMKFYMANRTDRHAYMYMFPLLQRAIALKEQEVKEEKPFRKLLAGQIMKMHGASLEQAQAEVDELVSWWKYKNRTHRALASDDKKALDMIVGEYGLRRKKEAMRDRLDHAKAVQLIQTADPDVIYIAHKTENLYVALTPMNNERLFLRETTWRFTKGKEVAEADRKNWVGVDGRRLRWLEVYRDYDIWDRWDKNRRMENFLTDPERDVAVQAALDWMQTRDKPITPLAITIAQDQIIRAFGIDEKVGVPKYLYSNRVNDPNLFCVALHWTRRGDGTLNFTYDRRHYTYYPYWQDNNPHNNGGKSPVVLWIDHDAVLADEQNRKRLDKAQEEHNALHARAMEVWEQVSAEIKERLIAQAHADHLAEHHDEELWQLEKEKFIKEAENKVPHPRIACDAAGALLERDIDFNRWTLGRIIEEAKKHGMKSHRRRFDAAEDDAKELAAYNLEQVITMTKEKT